ncbi:MAG: O-antigen ligase family protein [Clostridia bacterium]|nr:O-antigen ligase family protein [Clostridia bacterium]
MKTSLHQIRQDMKEPAQRALLLIALIPLFPEYISFFIVVFAGIFAWQAMRQNNQPIRIGFIGKLLIAYIGYMLLTTVYSRNPLSTFFTALMWVFLFAIYLILYNLLTDTDRYDSMMLYISGVAAIVGLLACCQYRIGFYVPNMSNQIWVWLDNIVYSWLHVDLKQPVYVLRACSTFANPNILSEYLTAVAPFVVYFNFYERRPELRLFCRTCLILTFGGVLFSFCRGGYLALLVLAVALIALNIRHRFSTVTLYTISAALLLPDEVVERFLTILPGIKLGGTILGSAELNSTGAILSDENFNTTADILNNTNTDFAINERFQIWLESLVRFLQKPVFGYGAGVETTSGLLLEQGVKAPHVHNIIIQLLLEGGIIALVIMLLIGAKVTKNGIELIRNGYGYSFWIGFALLGFASSFCIQGMVDYPLLTPKLVCNFMMIMALAEQAVSLYTAKSIPVRKKLRNQWRKVRGKTKA